MADPAPPKTPAEAPSADAGDAVQAAADDGAPPPAAESAVDASGGGVTVLVDVLPDGCMPLFFTGASQEIFSVVCDRDVTAANPFALLPLEKIKEDMKTRAAVSDFTPCKEQMLVSAS